VRTHIALAAWIAAFAVSCLSAQTSGYLTLRLATPEGTAIAGFEIELVLRAGEEPFAIGKTNADGIITFTALPPGDYSLRTGGTKSCAPRCKSFPPRRPTWGPSR